MCELLKHITCSLIYCSYVLIKTDDMEAQWPVKNWENSGSSIQKSGSGYFPWYVYGRSTSFNFSINCFGHLCYDTLANSILFSYLLEAYPGVVKCQNLLCSTPIRCSSQNSYLGIRIHHVLHRYIMQKLAHSHLFTNWNEQINVIK